MISVTLAAPLRHLDVDHPAGAVIEVEPELALALWRAGMVAEVPLPVPVQAPAPEPAP